MPPRTILPAAATLLVGVGLWLIFLDARRPPPPAPHVVPAVAARAIEPYSVITQDMLRAGAALPAEAARAHGAYPLAAAVGLMATERIAPGERVTGSAAKPIEDVRFVPDGGLEIVSFAAGVEQSVAGRLRPGHRINIYGIGRDAGSAPFTTLVDHAVWVVAVSAGGQPVSDATPRPDLDTGGYREEGGERERPATLVTVALEPARAVRLIDALGARGLDAWVTLSANRTAALPSPTPGRPTAIPDLDATARAVEVALRPTVPPGIGETGYGGAAGR